MYPWHAQRFSSRVRVHRSAGRGVDCEQLLFRCSGWCIGGLQYSGAAETSGTSGKPVARTAAPVHRTRQGLKLHVNTARHNSAASSMIRFRNQIALNICI